MVKFIFRNIFVVLILTVMSACIPSKTPTTEGTAERTLNLALLTEGDLVEQYYSVVENAKTSMTEPIYFAIGKELSKFGPQAMTPLIEFIGDNSHTHRERILTADVLKYHVHPSMMPALKAMLEPSYDGTTRGCIAYLVGFMPGPESDVVLRGLLEDEERRVWFSAKLGLAMGGDDLMIEKLKAMYRDDTTSVMEMHQIARVVILRERPEDLEFMARLVVDERLDEYQRAQTAQALGHLGNTEAIWALKECVQGAGAALKNVAEAAIEAIQRENKLEIVDSAT